MAINTQIIRIDLNTGKTIPVAFAHQNDTNRQLTFQLYNNGVAFTPSSTTVKFAYKSPIVNGQYSVITGSEMATGTVSGNTVTVTLPAKYTQVSGVGLLTMILTTSGNTLRPVNIKFVCQESADGDQNVLFASDWPDGLYDYMDNWLEENEPTEIANLKSDLNYNHTAEPGYVLRATNDGHGNEWAMVGTPTDAQAETAINAWLDEHPEATTTVQDNSLTFSKFNAALMGGKVPYSRPYINGDANNLEWGVDYVTPEMFGAVGDGVADDTVAIQAALDSGYNVIGFGTYLVGTGIERESVFVINHPLSLKGSFIDNRQPLTTNNLKNTGLFVLESDNVIMEISVVGNNNLPVDSAQTSNNISEVCGYAVSITTEKDISDCEINIYCENTNGIGHGAILKNSKINVIAKHSAYPCACNCLIGCEVTIHGEDIHRLFWGAAESSFITCYGKDYISTGTSVHFLFCDYTDGNGVSHLAENTKVFIFDLGTTISYGNTAYFGVNLQGENNTAQINAEVWLSGDMTGTTAGEYAYTINNVGTVNGKLIIHDSLITDGTQGSRMYNDIFDFTVYSHANANHIVQPKSTDTSATVNIYSAKQVALSNFSGKGYFIDCITVTTYTPNTVTGTIYIVNAVSIADFSSATVKRSPISDNTNFNLINQKPQNTQRINGSGVAFGRGTGKAWLSVPLPFVTKNTNYTVSVVTFGITDVIGGSTGANYVTVAEKSPSSIKLEYDNSGSTQITSGNMRWATYTIDVVFA